MESNPPKQGWLSPLALELIAVSALSLFVELLIVRWLSADIRAFTVFRTLPLVSTSDIVQALSLAWGDAQYHMMALVSVLLIAT